MSDVEFRPSNLVAIIVLAFIYIVFYCLPPYPSALRNVSRPCRRECMYYIKRKVQAMHVSATFINTTFPGNLHAHVRKIPCIISAMNDHRMTNHGLMEQQ